MKYILGPFLKFISLLLYTAMYVLMCIVVVIANIFIVLWHFDFDHFWHLDWLSDFEFDKKCKHLNLVDIDFTDYKKYRVSFYANPFDFFIGKRSHREEWLSGNEGIPEE